MQNATTGGPRDRLCLLLQSIVVAVPLANAAYADPNNAIVSGAVGVSTENVARGVSYSMGEPAAFGRLSWRQSLLEVAGTANSVSGTGASTELALAARLVTQWRGFEFKGGLERTEYPGAVGNYDYWEYGLGISRGWEWGSLELGLRASPDDTGGAQYNFLDGSRRLAATGRGTLNVKGRLGWRTYDNNERAGIPDYLHWSAGLELVRGAASFDVVYHDTDLPQPTRFPSDARIVARFTYRFSQGGHP